MPCTTRLSGRCSTIRISYLGFPFVESGLNALIIENCRLKRSDGISWPLYIIKKLGGYPSVDAIKSIVDTRDCVSMTLLYDLKKDATHIMPFVNDVMLSDDNYLKDSQWFLLYQLFRDGVIDNPYNDDTFNILRDNDVNFIISSEEPRTKAEEESEHQRIKSIFKMFQLLNKPADGV